MPDTAALDDPVGASLRGPHTHLARRHGNALAYVPDVATFVAVPASPGPADWDDLAWLLGPGGFADLFSSPAEPPPDWPPVFSLTGVQMVGPAAVGPAPAGGPDMDELGPADVPAMLALAHRTSPGPFWPRTIEMGRYVGIRDGGTLVAMAGERLHPPGFTEISAVRTAPEARGRGYAARLVTELMADVLARGERPFLHVASDNAAARGLYERLGFTVRRDVVFHGSRVPD
ncbi:MAG TPA: GNAT family N-acetyltransferase [Nocardioides sp.]|uniref:GNAT family N-acetyltransferase n=1 Tax=Nocardioides sp. TaxID=35761 RepID=UPI002EDB60CF